MTRTSKIIVGGFLVRAFLGQALFWISYLRLPIARSLQLGDGFWFFAADGPEYLLLANAAAEQGFSGIFFLADRTPSHLFVRLLAILVTAFGGVASLAILINCAAYVLTCAVLVRLRQNDVQNDASNDVHRESRPSPVASLPPLPSAIRLPRGEGTRWVSSRENETSRASPLRRGEKVPKADEGSPLWQNAALSSPHLWRERHSAAKNDLLLAAIAFSPAAMLFSLQLLKDTLFFFLIVLMVAIFRRWQELWRRDGAPGQLLACAAAMLAIVYVLAGIRWYFAAIVWAASAIFLALVSWPTRRRGLALAANAVLFVLLAQCVRVGSLDMPPQIARLLNPASVFQSTPAAVTRLVGKARRGFDNTPAATTIAPGWLVAPAAPPRAASSAPIPQTFAARGITGFSATFLPRFLAQPFGLIRVGGGRGFWLFAEIDTIVFDLVLLYVIIYCTRALRRSTAHATPLFVLLVLVFVFTAGPMIYTINNFGTLFRLRQMLYVIAAVIPITLRRSEREENGAC